MLQRTTHHHNIFEEDINVLVQDCSNSIADTLELLQSYTKLLIYEIFEQLVQQCHCQDLVEG